jgi:DNA-binding response OmpR family regulator
MLELFIFIYSIKNYLSEFLAQETHYNLKTFKLLAEFNKELLITTPKLIIIDQEYDLLQNIITRFESANVIYLGGEAEQFVCSILKPIDLNILLQSIDKIMTKNNNHNLIINDDWLLQTTNKKLINLTNNEIINLTEKESSIIKYLFNNKPNQVTKQTLLKVIWNYSENVDTHTLETHIYRLRQKLENHSNLLISDEYGYSLCISPRNQSSSI